MIKPLNGIGMTSQRSRDRLAHVLADMGIKSTAVLDVIRTIPRHLFIDEALASRAYDNTALPIGYQQTISQPYIVAKMTQALIQDRKVGNVLEVGTGCGYQTAVIANFATDVYTIERISGLLVKAKQRFQQLGYRNIRSKNADGSLGWPVYAPFDSIIVTAAPMGVPKELLKQLAVGGRFIIPVGRAGEQKLLLITRTKNNYLHEPIDSVNFVPMLGGIDIT